MAARKYGRMWVGIDCAFDSIGDIPIIVWLILLNHPNAIITTPQITRKSGEIHIVLEYTEDLFCCAQNIKAVLTFFCIPVFLEFHKDDKSKKTSVSGRKKWNYRKKKKPKKPKRLSDKKRQILIPLRKTKHKIKLVRCCD